MLSTPNGAFVDAPSALRPILFLLLVGFGFVFAPAPAWSATPVASSISLETYARRCSDPGCEIVAEEVTAIDTDAQATTLATLQATADAVAFDSAAQAGANATLAMTATWSGVASGNVGFAGDVGIFRPTAAYSGGCDAFNDRSDGFSYTFVSSTDGSLTVDYALECMPIEFITASGTLSVLLDGAILENASVSASAPTTSGTVTVPISLGTTHTLEIRPDLDGVGGTSCGPPPGWAWSCNGSAAWSFDVAAPVPSVGASRSGLAIVAFCAWAGAALAMARRPGSIRRA